MVCVIVLSPLHGSFQSFTRKYGDMLLTFSHQLPLCGQPTVETWCGSVYDQGLQIIQSFCFSRDPFFTSVLICTLCHTSIMIVTLRWFSDDFWHLSKMTKIFGRARENWTRCNVSWQIQRFVDMFTLTKIIDVWKEMSTRRGAAGVFEPFVSSFFQNFSRILTPSWSSQARYAACLGALLRLWWAINTKKVCIAEFRHRAFFTSCLFNLVPLHFKM